jgi:hypothetical protein
MNNSKWYKFLIETKEVTDPILREIMPKIEEYSQIVEDSIVDGEYFYVNLDDGKSRVGLVLDTQKGRIPFYRSSGHSEEVKEEGEWTIFRGYQPSRSNWAIIKKNVASFSLTQGKDRYLSILALVLGYLWDNKNLESKLTKVDFYNIANRRFDQVNEKIQMLNQQEDKYIEYELSELQGAFLNSYLQDKDALDSIVFDSTIPEQKYLGLKEIKSEELRQLRVFNKFLPTLEDVLG